MRYTSHRILFSTLASLIVMASVGATLLFSHLTSAHAASNNLVTNSGFESGNLNGWSCDPGTTTISTPVHSGAFAAQLIPSNATTGQCTQTIAVQPTTAYTLSAYVDGPYAYIGANGYSSTWTNSTSYTLLSTSFTTSASATSVTIYLHGWYAQGTVDIDDVALIGPAGAITPTPTSTPIKVATSTPVTQATNTPVATRTPTPTNTPAPTATPCANCGGSLPKHVLTGYWQNFTNGATPLRLREVSSNYDLLAVAFANADQSTVGAVTFGVDSGLSSALGGYTDAQFISDIATLHAQGKKVIISVGGQDGIISVNDATSATNFANSVYHLMQTYGFDGVDIDLENGINPTSMASALQQLVAKAGSRTIITLAPQTTDMQSTSSVYFQLALNIKDILTLVNTQYYNSGSMLGCNGNVYSEGTVDFLTALTCTQLQGGLRADQIGLGLPASPQGASSGYISPAIINAALDCLARGTNCGTFKPAATYPTIRGVMTWSTSWDAANGYNFANSVKAHLNTLP